MRMSTVPRGASIRVAAARVGAEVEISVIDDGPGIPRDQLEHIFDRFTRGDAGLTQRVGGTGLGLAISKSLVELHGGTIAADSGPGGGSTFRVRLPVAATSESPSPAAAESRWPKVLVADDSETILLLMQDEAGDGRLRGGDRHRRPGGDGGGPPRVDPGPDILLLDAMMPRKSGIDALRELRAEGVDTPALIVSAHQNGEDAERADRAGGERLRGEADRLRDAASDDRRVDGR